MKGCKFGAQKIGDADESLAEKMSSECMHIYISILVLANVWANRKKTPLLLEQQTIYFNYLIGVTLFTLIYAFNVLVTFVGT